MLNLIKRIFRFIKKEFTSPEKWARQNGVKIGQGCWISTKEFPSEGYLIEIGNNVRIASKTSLYTHGGVWTLRKLYNDPNLDYFGKIKIGNNTYIGEKCIILAGVTIGENCVIGAGSVVTKSVPDGCMVAGNPCKFVGYTDTYYEKKKSTNLNTFGMTPKQKEDYLLSLPDDAFLKRPTIITDR